MGLHETFIYRSCMLDAGNCVRYVYGQRMMDTTTIAHHVY